MAAASWLQPCIFCGRRRYAGGLLKESPEPPELFSNCIWLKPGGGMRRPAGACPGRHGQVNSGSPNPAEAVKPILQHPTSQPPCRSARKGWNRARTPDPINHNLFGKVLGGLGDSFKSPPALPTSPPRLPALPRASMRKSKRRRRFFFADCRQAGENVL